MRLYDGYIFDLDGTLYRGDEPIPGAVETVVKLKRKGAKLWYLTNNSSQTRQFYAEKLTRMGFPASEGDIGSSATGTAAYLIDQKVLSCFVVGEPGLVSTLRGAGIKVPNADDRGVVQTGGGEAESVVVGIYREFSYAMMDAAMQRIRAGARFIATNRDATFPLEAGRLAPGAGSIVAAIAECAQAQAFVVGKPNPYLIELALHSLGLSAKQVLVVGDREDTDLESGRRAACDTHLVLTGVESKAPTGQAYSEDLRGLISEN